MDKTAPKYFRYRCADGIVRKFKAKSLKATLKDIRNYNKKHNTRLSYGQYKSRKYNGLL